MARRAKSTPETSAADYLPTSISLPTLQEAVTHCRGCELYEAATQVVFGDGRAKARIMLVGEQPGDQEDKAGKPFVGPAGKLLDQALEEAGIDRADAYVTNAVKHFYFELQGKRRMHKTPRMRHVSACRPWLEAELNLIQPEVVICLGATPAQVFLGSDFRITQQRGQTLSASLAKQIVATWHPSAVLRSPKSEDRERMRQEMIADLKVAADLLANP